MTSSKLSPRRAHPRKPPICIPPKPPPPPPTWTYPDTIAYTGHASYQYMGETIHHYWSYTLYRPTPTQYWGEGYDDDGNYSCAQIDIADGPTGTFTLHAYYDTYGCGSPECWDYDTPLETPQPHHYTWPPWDDGPPCGQYEATADF